MKKTLILAPLLLVALASCRKDRSCACTQNGTDLGTANYVNVTRSEAKNACQGLEAQYSISNPGATCSLK